MTLLPSKQCRAHMYASMLETLMGTSLIVSSSFRMACRRVPGGAHP